MKKEIGSFVVGDSTKCTGCKACELACFITVRAITLEKQWEP